MTVGSSVYIADFETTVRNDFACVWVYCIVNVFDENDIYFGYSIEEFMKFIYQLSPTTIFFHNLKFDGMYILDYLLRNGYVYSDAKALSLTEFNTLIGEQGEFYSITIQGKKNKIQIWDSLKIFNFSVKEIAQSFKLDTMKGEIDYNKERPEGYIPDEIELDYVKNDVLIVAKAMRQFLSKGYNRMTIASNALAHFKTTLKKDKWKYIFPELSMEVDGFCRKSYKGGFTYVNPKYQGKIIEKGCVYDMNSMYPYTLYYLPMPIGIPEYFMGKPPDDKLYIIHIFVEYFAVKKDHIPTIQLKGSFRYLETEYLTEGEDVDLYLTSVDYKLFKDHYDYDNLEEIEGYAFTSRTGLFKDYIDEFMEIKMKTKGGERQIAKLFLNGLYGKFGSKIEKIKKIPYFEDNRVKFRRETPELSKPVYIPLASFVTAYARDNIIRNAQRVYDRFVYCDTDSLHLIGTEVPDIPIDDSKLGYYKCESIFTNGKYLRPKTYIETIDGELSVKCCGMNKNIAETKVTYDNFKEGEVFDGKLQPKIIAGGVVLKETTFTIKNNFNY